MSAKLNIKKVFKLMGLDTEEARNQFKSFEPFSLDRLSEKPFHMFRTGAGTSNLNEEDQDAELESVWDLNQKEAIRDQRQN